MAGSNVCLCIIVGCSSGGFFLSYFLVVVIDSCSGLGVAVNVFSRWAMLKNYFSQGNIYMGIANFFITMFTWLAVLRLSFFWYLVIPTLGLLLVTLVGALDFYYIKKHEVRHANTMNDMKEQLDRIEEKMCT